MRVRVPPPVTKYGLHHEPEGGNGIVFESGRVLAAPPTAYIVRLAAPALIRRSHCASALRNHSPPHIPLPKPIVVPSAPLGNPPRVIVESVTEVQDRRDDNKGSDGEIFALCLYWTRVVRGRDHTKTNAGRRWH